MHFHLISGVFRVRDFPNFFYRFWRFTDFAFFAKFWPKNMQVSQFQIRLFTFLPGEMTLTNVVVTKHRKWYLQMSETLSMPIFLALFELTIDILLADVTKPEKSNIPTLTCLWRYYKKIIYTIYYILL